MADAERKGITTMKRQAKRDQLLKTLLLGRWIHSGFNPNDMATVIDIQSILQDPWAYIEMAFQCPAHDRQTAEKILDAIMDGDFETRINDTANALREKDDYTGASSVHATKDMLDVMGIDMRVRDVRG